MTALEKAPTILTRAGALKLRDRIRRNLQAADDDLLRAWQGEAWVPLGLESFGAFCDMVTMDLEFVRLSVPVRRERVLQLVGAGASERDAAAACGVSPATIHADVVELQRDGRLVKPDMTRGADGVLRPATVERPAPQVNPDRHGLTLLQHELWQRVDAAGEVGLTALELERRTRWRHGRVSALLHRLERRGAVVRDREQVRDGYTAYVARPLG
jgi:transposase